ncbi:GGDEF domain-containing protein [Marinobacter sp. MDS2]|uniref:GGDEF domain-containing protein n=1 Tax=Marinobacter sp. MDS2 TaxID=3065961 RepID=UPI00273CA41C|nr:GGDEF domain-containing protein [Marinobacter sp. MDS2]MDP4548322.1 GGDEF domain-containing protein [Marinobacter sp. MDS2]
MTETRLRTWTHSAAYALAAVFIGALALQNLRYGFYPLFYLASMMATVLFVGLIYTLISRRQQLSAPGHLIILSLLNAGLVISSLTLEAPGISHWAMPLLVLNLTILPLRRGLGLSALLVATVSISLLFRHPFADAMISSSGLGLMLAVVGLYIWGYDYMAQSAQNLSTTDPITGAHNARFLDETLQKEISRAIATGHPLSVASIGLSHAEEIRDLHGKAGLQNLLKNMTERLFETIRAGDTLYTINESEFFLILPFTPEEGVRVIAERIRRNLIEHDWPEVGKISVSLGCTTRGNGDTSTYSLRSRATNAMEEANTRGANSAWFSPGEPVKA